MKETILDIVDDEENIIGKTTYIEAHEKKLLHRASIILVFRDKTKNEVLMQKRSPNVKLPGKWCFTSGHVDTGETPLEAAKREFSEEVLDLKELPEKLCESLDFEFVLKTNTYWNDDPEIRYLYELVYGGEFNSDNFEIDKQKFVSLANLFDEIENEPEKFDESTIGLIKLYREHELNKNKCC